MATLLNGKVPHESCVPAAFLERGPLSGRGLEAVSRHTNILPIKTDRAGRIMYARAAFNVRRNGQVIHLAGSR
jgi:hypothetical protein